MLGVALCLLTACGGGGGVPDHADAGDLGLEGASGEDASADVAGDGPAGDPSDATDSDGLASAPGDGATGQDGTTSGVDVVAPPDGFPMADTSDCPLGSACLLPGLEFCERAVCNGLGQCVHQGREPGCCTSDADCDGLLPTHPCELFACVGGQCAGTLTPGCCGVDEDCDDAIPCTDDVCSAPGARCSHCPWTCGCPGEGATWSSSFEGLGIAAAGWSVTDFQPSDNVTWRLSERRFIKGPTAAWLGHGTCPTYHSGPLDPDCQPLGGFGGVVRAQMKSLAIALPDYPGGFVALFWLWADVEPVLAGGGAERDVLTVLVEDQLTLEIWPLTTSLAAGKSTGGQWRPMAVDLLPWRGRQVRLIFSFDTFDASDNHHEGVYIDELAVLPRCDGGCCEVDEDCAGMEVTDPCMAARCLAMSDGSGAVCAVVPKAPGGGCDVCSDASLCDDSNPCTTDACGPDGACLHEAYCCFEESVRQDDFEAGLAGWFVTDPAPGDGVGWTTTQADAVTGAFSAWVGNPVSGTYEAADDGVPGDAVRAALTSTALVVPDAGQGSSLGVEFWLKLSTEWDGQAIYDNPLGVDRLTLEVLVAGEPTIVWTSDDVEGSTGGLWVPVAASLEPWAGTALQLRLTFDTLDGNANAFGGPHIDDLRVGRICETAESASPP